MKKFILLLGMITTLGVSAQDVKLTASAPGVVELNEHFKLTYTITSKDVETFNAPKFSGFRYSGPSRSTQSSVKIINGNMSREIKTSYTYYMKPQNVGKFTIPAASAVVGGKTYQSQAVTIEVVKGGASAQKPKQQQKSRGVISEEDIFMRFQLSKTRVYEGEHIVATLKLYSRATIADLRDFEMPEFNGFWSQEIKRSKDINFKQENVNNQVYKTAVLSQYLLFPQRTGELQLNPAKLNVIAQVRVRQPSFFDSGIENVQKRIQSAVRKVQVKPLPAGAPASFKGAVGQFSISAEATPKSLKANEAVNYIIKVEGNGNLKLVDPLQTNFPADFDQFEPEFTHRIQNTATGARGTKEIKYLLVPLYAGDFTIPEVAFSYFDPQTGQYVTRNTQSFEIHVEENEGAGQQVVTSGGNKGEYKILDEDIRFIKQDPGQLQPRDEFFFGSQWFTLSYAGPAALFAVLLLVRMRRQKLQDDQELLRNRQAGKVSRKRLKTAAGYLKGQNNEAFYTETLRALWGYLSDKLDIPQAHLNRGTIEGRLQEKGIDESLAQELKSILDTCEFAKFAPGGNSQEMGKIYDRTSALINQLEKQLKKANA